MTGRSRRFDAVVFDFDGTILDTETPVFEAWRRTYVDAGVEPITRAEWQQTIGQDETGSDTAGRLARALGFEQLPPELVERRRTHRDEILAAQPIRPGVVEWIAAVQQRGLGLAIGSSSPIEWVDRHLIDRGLVNHFAIRSCAGRGVPGKPAPDVYATACERLGVDPARALAIEDSPNGLRGAVAAGLRCIATPGPMTENLAFHEADAVASDLSQLRPQDWLDQ